MERQIERLRLVNRALRRLTERYGRTAAVTTDAEQAAYYRGLADGMHYAADRTGSILRVIDKVAV